VEVLQITLSNENQSGIDWNFVTNTAKLGTLSFNGPPALPTSSGSIGLVKSGDSENFLLLRALEKFGRVSTSYSSVITTMNRQAVPLGSVSTQSYLKQSTPSITTSATGLAVVGQAGLTPGEIVTGFTLNLLPIVLDSNHVLMQASINLSSLKELKTYESGEGTSKQSIQQPNISTFTTQQKMMVKSGDTIVLSGFENETTESRQSDLVRKTVPGTKDSNRNKTTLVVLITPRLLN
jgi:type IVB pilus formation R64 PilN family outer membrane protein